MTVYHDELFDVAARDDPEKLLALLPAGTSPSDLRNREGTTLVLHCVYSGARNVLEQLAALFPQRSLHEAAALGQRERVMAPVDGDDSAINLLSADGWTPLHLAAFFGHAETVQALLDRGADPHVFSRGFEINLPVQAACAAGASAAALSLISATISVDETGPSGTTALMSAAHNGLVKVIDALLAKGADPSRRDAAGKSAGDYAGEAGHRNLARKLTGALPVPGTHRGAQKGRPDRC